MSLFTHVPLAPSDPILGLTQAFLQDPRPSKVNLGVGLFKDEQLHTPILSSVKRAEELLLQAQKSKQYLPIEGDAEFLQQTGALLFGAELWQQENKRISIFQTLGGTGALKIGGTFIREECPGPVWISNPSWPNHRGVFTHCGLTVEAYPYYDLKHHHLDFEQMVACFRTLSPRSILVLHACCHNPTGCDLSRAQWQLVAQVCKERQLLPFFDLAYQGLGEGLAEDAWSVRFFLEQGFEMLVALSYSKNLSLYAERVGALCIVSGARDAITSRVKQMIRVNYSNPPLHGAQVAALVLKDPTTWTEELRHMRERISLMRSLLAERFSLERLAQGKGMFSFLGLHTSQVHRLITEYGIYMPSDGRINVCGLNLHNIDYVVASILNVVKS